MQDELNSFFQARPAVSKAAFARECGFSNTFLTYLTKGTSKPSQETSHRIRLTMAKYGYETIRT